MKTICGKCSNCGGPVTLPDSWMSIYPPKPTCESCGATAKGPDDRVIPMNPAPPNRLLRQPAQWKCHA